MRDGVSIFQFLSEGVVLRSGERRAESEERSYSEKKEVTLKKFRTLSHIRKNVLHNTLLCHIFVLYSINIFYNGRK